MSKDDIGSMIRTATKNISGGQQLSQSEQAIVSNLAISMRESQRNWQPIFVRETGLYQFQLIGSSLILEAAKLAGLEVVYCIQVDESENTSQDIINIQNTIQGTGGESVMDLSPLLRRIDQLDDTINNFNQTKLTNLENLLKSQFDSLRNELIEEKFIQEIADQVAKLLKPTKKKSIEELIKNPIKLNTASKSDLLTIPGIGPQKALAILNRINTIGNFKEIDELKEIKGILPKLKKCFVIE